MSVKLILFVCVCLLTPPIILKPNSVLTRSITREGSTSGPRHSHANPMLLVMGHEILAVFIILQCKESLRAEVEGGGGEVD